MHVENSNSQNVNFTIASCQRGTSLGSYRICMGDGSSFFLSIDFFLEHKLSKGLIVSQELLTKFKSESLFVEAYMKANSLLSRQLYSKFNLKTKLLTKDYDKQAVERAIEYLQDQGRVNDEYFAKSWVNNRIKNKLDSYNGLLAGLMKKGVSVSISKDVLEELYTEEIEYNIIKKSINKLMNQGKTTDKTVEALTRKGFKYSRIVQFIP